jgi:hypothetical protein
LFLAIVYVTILNLITIDGLGMLLEGWMPTTRFIHILFIFPYFIVTALIMFFINYLVMLPLKNLRKERSKKPVLLPIVIYTIISILLFLYINYSNKLI